jgi:hypothetical protein
MKYLKLFEDLNEYYEVISEEDFNNMWPGERSMETWTLSNREISIITRNIPKETFTWKARPIYLYTGQYKKEYSTERTYNPLWQRLVSGKTQKENVFIIHKSTGDIEWDCMGELMVENDYIEISKTDKKNNKSHSLLDIDKVDDDWYRVYMTIYDKGDIYDEKFYKCDQIEGVIKLLKDLEVID